jgi:hypothetical protein
MSFTNYTEVKNWDAMIAFVTKNKIMPPWGPDPEYSHFKDENYLTNAEIQLIQDWVQDGSLQGDPNNEFPFPSYPANSILGPPDLIISMPKAYKIEGNNQDDFRAFVIPSGVTANKDIAGIEFIPGNKRVVHHAGFALDTSGRARTLDAATPEAGYTSFGTYGFRPAEILSGYINGALPFLYDDGVGNHLWKNSDVVFQIHYAPTPVDEYDSSSLNIHFAKSPIEDYVKGFYIRETNLTNGPLVIPKNTIKSFHGEKQLTEDMLFLAIYPHMHQLGKTWKVYAVTPANDTLKMVKINDWRFNWQNAYNFEKPLFIPAGSIIHCHAMYDNTTGNPNNPSFPPVDVAYGKFSSDEMFTVIFYYIDGHKKRSIYSEDVGDSISMVPPTSITTNATLNENILDVYPNPATNQINLKFNLTSPMDHLEVLIFNANGKQVQKELFEEKKEVGEVTLTVPFIGLATGVYFISVGDGQDFLLGRRKMMILQRP